MTHDQFFSVNNVLREDNEIKQKIKNHDTSLGCIIQKMGAYYDSCKHHTANKNSCARKTNQNRFFYQTVLLLEKTWLLLKMMNSTVLIIFEMINLKLIK